MERRRFLELGGLAMMAGLPSLTFPAHGQTVEPESDSRRIPLIHIYADENGDSRIEQLFLDPEVGSVPMKEAIFVQNPVGETEMYTVPARSFSVNLEGTLRVTTSLGESAICGPGQLVFLSDTTGKGHSAVFESPITTFVVYVDDDFALGPRTTKA